MGVDKLQNLKFRSFGEENLSKLFREIDFPKALVYQTLV